MSEANGSLEVSLDICNFHNTGGGWISTSASNDAPYSYKYVGGNHPDNNGHTRHKVDHRQAKITVQLVGDPRYEFVDITFIGDNDHQLSSSGNHKTRREIINQCTGAMDAHYKVMVRDTQQNVTVLCDPSIRNRPV